METVSSNTASPNANHLSANQLPTFVTQPNAVQNSKKVASAGSVDHQGDNIQHVVSSGGSIMVIQQPGVPSAVGLVASSVASSQSATSGTVQGTSDHPNLGMYTTAAGLPAEYVLPGTNMISSGAQSFQVHVPVVPQQEGSSEGNYQGQESKSIDNFGARTFHLRQDLLYFCKKLGFHFATAYLIYQLFFGDLFQQEELLSIYFLDSKKNSSHHSKKSFLELLIIHHLLYLYS